MTPTGECPVSKYGLYKPENVPRSAPTGVTGDFTARDCYLELTLRSSISTASKPPPIVHRYVKCRSNAS